MTDADAEALGRRLAACEGFRWMPGMLDTEGDRVVGRDLDGTLLMVYDRYGSVVGRTDESWTPDLRDPATIGCVLALVRARHGVRVCADGEAFDDGSGPIWGVWLDDDRWTSGATEAEALVAAMEAP